MSVEETEVRPTRGLSDEELNEVTKDLESRLKNALKKSDHVHVKIIFEAVNCPDIEFTMGMNPSQKDLIEFLLNKVKKQYIG